MRIIRSPISLGALLVFTLGAAPAAPPSHTPNAPLTHSRAGPYQSVEVLVRTRDGQTLAGTLTLPSGRAKFPAMLLLSSADATDRDGSNMHGLYHPMRQIADTLSRHGIAVLRLDDRGKGKSTGRLDTLTTAERASDARDALAFLRARPGIDRRHIGLLGHSEGALIAAMVAAEDTSVRALFLMASTAHTGRSTVEWQQHFAIAAARISPALRRNAFREAMIAWSRRLTNDRWAAFFDSYDPLATARRVHAPVLILQGTTDVSCPPPDAETLAGAMRTAGNPDVTVQRFEGIDHAFLRVSGFQDGVAYGDGAFLVSSVVLARIVDWAVPHLR